MNSAILLVVALLAAAPVEPPARWNGMIADETLQKLAPADSFLADAESLAKVWKAWRPKDEVPTVDFTKEIIVVGVVPGPNTVLMRPSLDDQGDLRFVVAGTKKGGPGFGYLLLKVSREGVKTVNSKPMEANGVRGVISIPEKVGSFKDHALEIMLWEYDPLLADASATLIDKLLVEKYSHEEGKTTETPFAVGTKLKPREDRRYYITVFVVKGKDRTHIGEQDGKNGLCNVLTQGNPSTVKMIARPVR